MRISEPVTTTTMFLTLEHNDFNSFGVNTVRDEIERYITSNRNFSGALLSWHTGRTLDTTFEFTFDVIHSSAVLYMTKLVEHLTQVSDSNEVKSKRISISAPF